MKTNVQKTAEDEKRTNQTHHKHTTSSTSMSKPVCLMVAALFQFKLCFLRSSPTRTALCPIPRPLLSRAASRSWTGSVCSASRGPTSAALLPSRVASESLSLLRSASTSASPCSGPPPPWGESGTWRRRRRREAPGAGPAFPGIAWTETGWGREGAWGTRSGQREAAGRC